LSAAFAAPYATKLGCTMSAQRPDIQDPFPWFGYIGGVRVFDDAMQPTTTTTSTC
jgi:hypothetical protein